MTSLLNHLFVCRLLGLAPYSFVSASSISISSFWRIYSIALLGSLASIQSYFCFDYFVSVVPSAVTTDDLFEYIVSYVNVCVPMVAFPVTNFSIMFHQFYALPSVLESAFQRPGCSKRTGIILSVLAAYFAFYSSAVALWDGMLQGDEPAWFLLCRFTDDAHSIAVLEFEQLLFFDLVLSGGWSLDSINCEINRLREKRPFLNHFPADILAIRKKHQEAVDFLQNTCTCFGVQNVCSAIICVVLLVTNIFAYSKSLYEGDVLPGVQVLTIMYISNQILPNLAVIIASDWASKQGNLSATLVHHYINAEGITDDEKEELKIFSMQLIHRRVELSVLGLYTLDCKLLYTVAGALTTYLIVLLQFQISAYAIRYSVQSTKLNESNGENVIY